MFNRTAAIVTVGVLGLAGVGLAGAGASGPGSLALASSRTANDSASDSARDASRAASRAAKDAAADAARAARRAAKHHRTPGPTPSGSPSATAPGVVPPAPTFTPTPPPGTGTGSGGTGTGTGGTGTGGTGTGGTGTGGSSGSPGPTGGPGSGGTTNVGGSFVGYFAPYFVGIPTKLFATNNYQNLADGTSSSFLRIFYPAGSSAPSCGSCTPGGGAQADVPIASGAKDDATLTYSVRFPVGFQFVKGGKLPGLCGGTCNTGGKDPNGTDGWSQRLMWRAGGVAEVYSYTATTRGYGDELAKGAWTWQADGKWHTVTEHVHLNTPGVADGYVDMSYDGVPVSHSAGILFRTISTLRIDGLIFSTFYGGHDSTWAPTANMHVDFANFGLS